MNVGSWALRRAALVGLSVGGLLAGVVLLGPPASADGLHLLPRVWKLGCAINYSLDPRAEADYGPNIATALEDIHIAAGFGFTQLMWGDSRASIRFRVVDELPGYLGLAGSDGDIRLLAAPNMPQDPRPSMNSMLRDQVAIHETLHVLGLDHDSSNEVYETTDEVMYPGASWGRLTFGEGDREGMAHVSALNGCLAPDPLTQPKPTVPLVNVATPAQPTVTSVPDVPAASAEDSTASTPTPSSTSATAPVAGTSTPSRQSALERCLANLGLRARDSGHYCPPLKTEPRASRGSQIGHGRITARHAHTD